MGSTWSTGHAYGDGDPELADDVRSRYTALLESIRTPTDIAVDVTDRGANRWTVAICTGDALGRLALIVGLLAAYRLGINGATILTLSFPVSTTEKRTTRPKTARRQGRGEPSAPARRLLDVFDVSASVESAPSMWLTFHADLAGLVATSHLEDARDDIINRVSQAFRELEGQPSRLLPVVVDVSNPPASSLTKLIVRSVDTPGFLFAFAIALAGFTIDVVRADIRTENGEARDTFWVTDLHGHPISDPRQVHELRVATTLIKQFTYLLPRSPNPGQALRQFNALILQILSRPAWTGELARLGAPGVLEALADLMGVSRFLWEDFLRMQHESLFPVVLDVSSEHGERSKAEMRDDLTQRLLQRDSRDAQVDELNAFKDREMFRIDLQHIVRTGQFSSFSRELTSLAEVAVEAATELADADLRGKFGSPTVDGGGRCPLCVCALGKFGGQELGFGSDLELIFVFESEGHTSGPRSILNSEYYSNLVQVFLRDLRARQEGIFEVDLRLRPFGKAGALAISLDGFRDYYANGRGAEQFERLALVRLRPVAGDAALASDVQHARDAFVYSGRPLDRSNVLHLRHRQANELVPRGEVNAKYSDGGLVDLEYFIQSLQIAVGASDPSVRVANTLMAIDLLERGNHISSRLAEELRSTYDFFRRLIDALRVVRGNARDLTIPPETSREFAYLARRLTYSVPDLLGEEIVKRMAFARSLW